MPMNPTEKRGLRPVHLDARSAAKVQLSVQPDDVLIVSEDVAGQLVRTDGSFKPVDEVPDVAPPQPYAVCEHGKVRSWTGLAVPGETLPEIEQCDVCDADATPLDEPAAAPKTRRRRTSK